MKEGFSGLDMTFWLNSIKKCYGTTAEIMEIGIPVFHAKNQSYTFKLSKGQYQSVETLYYELNTTEFQPPASELPFIPQLITEFIQGTKKYFSVPLVLEKVLKRLRHEFVKANELPDSSGWYMATYVPVALIIKATDITLQWTIQEFKPTDPQIPSDFLNSTTPRPTSPEQTPEVRTIQVHDSLIPVGDIPLSDLPPLNFSAEETIEGDPEKEEKKRRIREAKLKLALAKLKAQRMEQKYYERYGEQLEESESSDSEFSDSENEAFARYSHS